MFLQLPVLCEAVRGPAAPTCLPLSQASLSAVQREAFARGERCVPCRTSGRDAVRFPRRPQPTFWHLDRSGAYWTVVFFLVPAPLSSYGPGPPPMSCTVGQGFASCTAAENAAITHATAGNPRCRRTTGLYLHRKKVPPQATGEPPDRCRPAGANNYCVPGMLLR